VHWFGPLVNYLKKNLANCINKSKRREERSEKPENRKEENLAFGIWIFES
jgi:hypothetical protein